MEHRISASSKDNGGQFPGRLDMYGSTYQIQPLAAPSFFSGSSSSSCRPSQAPAHKSEHGSTYLSDLSSYMESFPFVNEHCSADSPGHAWTCGPSPQMGCRLEVPSGMPPEALLDVISNTQRKLQHLEVLARMMIQGSRHQGITQQQQSLSLQFASVMSQLFATTANFSSSSSFQARSPPPPQVNDTFDFSIDGFNEDELNNTLGAGSFYSPPSGMDVTNSEICEDAGVHLSADLLDSRATKIGAPVASSDEAAKVFASVNKYINITESNPSKEGISNGPPEISKNCMVHDSEDHREEEDDGEGESLPPGSYDLVELAATEILAEHTHFCEICSKGFKRDANLRMHMRGHGDEYKTAAALARPDKMPHDASVKLRRYSCPYAGCKRNKKHPRFQSLKTMLCVKNHYRRSHCPKLLVCSRCKVKKFSVVADLKTHEKHCGQDKWQCSCGTTFSRKDKLYGHIGLFAGHTPATPTHEVESLLGFGDVLEVLGSSKANASGTAGLPAVAACVMQDNLVANYVDVIQGRNSYSASVMGARANESDVSASEQSLTQREKNSFLSFDGGAMIRESPFTSGSSSGILSDGLELQNLLTATDGLFHQKGGTN